jgi:hypothetical protein
MSPDRTVTHVSGLDPVLTAPDGRGSENNIDSSRLETEPRLKGAIKA